MSANSDFTQRSQTKLSAATKAFVPSSLMTTDVPQFPSYDMSSAAPSEMNSAYQYDPYMMQNQVPAYPRYDTTQTSFEHAVQQAQKDAILDLDDYSDWSSDDEPHDKPTLPVVESIVELGKKPLSPERSETPTTPTGSTCAPESDVGSLELDSSDNDQDCVAAADAKVPSFSILELLKLRHAVPWVDGAEEGLAAEEVPPCNEHKPEEVPAANEVTSRNEQKPSALSRLQSCVAHRPPARHSSGRKKKGSDKGSGKGSDKGSGSEELHISDSSWTSQMAHRRETRTGNAVESPSTEEVVRTMKSILNKLTIEKFEPLYAKLVSCGIETTVQLEALIHEVFEKATSQHHFVPMYADLCVRLHGHFIEHPITDDPKMTFKKILLNGCQAFFEKHLKPPANLDTLDEEERVALTFKYKMQMLGNIKFVGALLIRQMLASKVLFAICEELLGAPTPESLESLAALLTVVGPTFDMSAWPAHQLLVDIFDRVKALTETAKINCRVRCLLKDLLELRASRWHDRKPKKIDGPSTLRAVADTQAAEHKANGDSGKAPGKKAPPRSPAKTWPGQAKKVWPGQAMKTSASVEKAGERFTSLLASDLFTRSAQATAPKQSYQRINSLAGLKGVSKGEQAVDQKETRAQRSRKQPDEGQFDKEACRKEVLGALAELRVSLEVKEALVRISDLSVPFSQQSAELSNMLEHIVEEGSAAVRKVSFQLVACLFTQGHWKPHVLDKTLQGFVDGVCPDLKCDIPMLPTILCEELSPALAALVESGMLKQSQLDALAV